VTRPAAPRRAPRKQHAFASPPGASRKRVDEKATRRRAALAEVLHVLGRVSRGPGAVAVALEGHLGRAEAQGGHGWRCENVLGDAFEVVGDRFKARAEDAPRPHGWSPAGSARAFGSREMWRAAERSDALIRVLSSQVADYECGRFRCAAVSPVA